MVYCQKSCDHLIIGTDLNGLMWQAMMLLLAVRTSSCCMLRPRSCCSSRPPLRANRSSMVRCAPFCNFVHVCQRFCHICN